MSKGQNINWFPQKRTTEEINDSIEKRDRETREKKAKNLNEVIEMLDRNINTLKNLITESNNVRLATDVIKAAPQAVLLAEELEKAFVWFDVHKDEIQTSEADYRTVAEYYLKFRNSKQSL